MYEAKQRKEKKEKQKIKVGNVKDTKDTWKGYEVFKVFYEYDGLLEALDDLYFGEIRPVERIELDQGVVIDVKKTRISVIIGKQKLEYLGKNTFQVDGPLGFRVAVTPSECTHATKYEELTGLYNVVMLHLSEELRDKDLTWIPRVLSPGGYLVLLTESIERVLQLMDMWNIALKLSSDMQMTLQIEEIINWIRVTKEGKIVTEVGDICEKGCKSIVVVRNYRMMDVAQFRNEMDLFYNTIVTLPYGHNEVANEIYTWTESVQGEKLDLFPQVVKKRTGWTILTTVEPNPSAEITINESTVNARQTA